MIRITCNICCITVFNVTLFYGFIEDSNCFYVKLIKPSLGWILGISLMYPCVPNILSLSIFNQGFIDHSKPLLDNFKIGTVLISQAFIYSAFNLISCRSQWPTKVFWKVAAGKRVTLRIIIANWWIFNQGILITRSFNWCNPIIFTLYRQNSWPQIIPTSKIQLKLLPDGKTSFSESFHINFCPCIQIPKNVKTFKNIFTVLNSFFV